ncbi:glycosyltransferase family 2 protein [Schaalia vaccimaxillae]|uniref:glycosyltransferase family 2 protein n=1 Tax=Schaalia vaccimaxillae TaxID=183916 RepID=UPI000414B045|nr:glycosyltransferase [Schaalia vaccimaxillae]
MPFISIIIPVYNAEKYLRFCLSSIEEQTFTDWEVILVDDGSSDSSPRICDEYSDRDARFRTFHQLNSGTSAARNTALRACTGVYVTFMDNDDWWLDSTCLERVASCLSDRPVDLLWHMSCRSDASGSQVLDTGSTTFSDVVRRLSVEDGIRFVVDHDLTTSAVWTKVVRRSLIDEHAIFFPEGMRNEDTQWSAQVIAYCSSVTWYDERFYVYRMGHSYAQTSRRLADSSVRDLERVLRENLELAKTLTPGRASALRAFLAYPFIVWVAQAEALHLLNPVNEGESPLLDQMKTVVGSSNGRPVRMVRWSCRILGPRITARILGLFFKRRHPAQVA